MMHNSANKIEQIKALENGKGIQYLLNEAYKILGNPMSMHDMDDRTVAYTENIITDDSYWNECVTYGVVGSETLEFFRTEYFIYDIANAKTVTALITDKLKYDRIFGKIYIKGNIRAVNLCMIACNKPFEDDDPLVFEEFCKILSRELDKNDNIPFYGKIYQETLIRQLIDGSYKDKKYYSARVEDIYKGLKSYLYLAVVDISRCDPGYTKLRYFIDLFKQTQPEFKYSIYNNYITIIMSSDDATLNVGKVLNKLYKVLELNNMFVGISRNYENLFESHQYYIEAANALNKGLKKDNNQQIFLYDESR